MYQSLKSKKEHNKESRLCPSFFSNLLIATLFVSISGSFSLPTIAQQMTEQDKVLASIEELVVQDKFKDAISGYSKLIVQTPEAKLYILRGSTQILAQDYAAALSDFRLADQAAQKEKKPELGEVARLYIIEMESLLKNK